MDFRLIIQFPPLGAGDLAQDGGAQRRGTYIGVDLTDSIPVRTPVVFLRVFGYEAGVENVEIGWLDSVGLSERKEDEENCYREGGRLDPAWG